ncbi:MAG: hypothetical protein WCT32_05405 [Patescibacteria group bacterium]|jgi:hypothetical protein
MNGATGKVRVGWLDDEVSLPLEDAFLVEVELGGEISSEASLDTRALLRLRDDSEMRVAFESVLEGLGECSDEIRALSTKCLLALVLDCNPRQFARRSADALRRMNGE